jgi:cytochrome P450
LIIRTVHNAIHHESLEGWNKNFADNGKGGWTVDTRPAGQRVIITADVENIKAVLATQFGDYGKGEPFHKDWKEFLGDSIFTTDGDLWHGSRQLIRPQFIKDRVSDLDTFERHVQVLMRAIANGGVKGAPGVGTDNVAQGRILDVSNLFFRYTLDSATDFLLGSSVNSLETPRQEFAEAFGEVQRVQNLIARAGYVLSVLLSNLSSIISPVHIANAYQRRQLGNSSRELPRRSQGD